MWASVQGGRERIGRAAAARELESREATQNGRRQKDKGAHQGRGALAPSKERSWWSVFPAVVLCLRVN